jgi:hypothetical protein
VAARLEIFLDASDADFVKFTEGETFAAGKAWEDACYLLSGTPKNVSIRLDLLAGLRVTGFTGSAQTCQSAMRRLIERLFLSDPRDVYFRCGY